MRWKAHTRTAQKVLEVFGAMHFNKYEQDLINGVVSPDNEDDKNHYEGREKTVLEYAIRARDKRLKYDTPASFFLLGVAFHYIQDMWTSIGPDSDNHKLYLDMIDRCDIANVHESLEKYYPVRQKRVLEQFKALEKRLGKPLESEEELKDLVMMRKPYESSAFLDLNFSFRVCYRVAEMVLRTMYNVGLQESLELVRDEYVERIKEREVQERREIEALEVKVEEMAIEGSSMNGLNRWSMVRKLNKRKEEYESKKYLIQIIHDYEAKVRGLCTPHENWHNIDKPDIDLEKILNPQVEIEPLKTSMDSKSIKMALEIDR